MSGFAASPAQRRKVAGQACINCLGSPCDPAHLCDRSLGGCDEPDCVVALCRRCHKAFDEGGMDLLPALEPRHRAEQAHMVAHLGLARAFYRATNTRWVPDRRAA